MSRARGIFEMKNEIASASVAESVGGNLWFGIITCVLVIVAHAVAYLTHEYSHTVVAWMTGWMQNPLALDYGRPTLYNVLFLGDVGDNVQYSPIFSAGHGVTAAMIALAGTFIGNFSVYFILYQFAKLEFFTSRPLALSAVYWLAVMSAGNVWGYVPIRAITTHADIATAASGFGISVWALFPFLIVPSLYLVYHFFWKMFPRDSLRIAGSSASREMLIIVLTAYWFFAFFGGDGTDGSYGLVSQLLAITSKYFLFPLSVMYLSYKRDDLLCR
jgi:hypothetical protein